MSLTSLSSNSLTRIFECLNDEYSTVFPLRRTCYKIDNSARKGNFHKVNATFVEVCAPDFDEKKDGYLVYVTIYGKKYKKAYEDCRVLRNVTNLPEMIIKSLERVKCVTELGFCDFTISNDVINNLLNIYEKLRTVKKLHLHNEKIVASSDQITKLLEIGQIDSIDFETYSELRQLNDSHILNLKNIAICTWEVTRCPGITNHSVNLWIQNIPKTILLKNIKTSITFKEIWELILTIVKIKKEEKNYYTFGILQHIYEDEDLKFLLKVQREQGFTWKTTHNYQNLLNYEVTFNDLVFVFRLHKLENNLFPMHWFVVPEDYTDCFL